MTPTVVILIALAAGEAWALIKVRKQNKRIAKLETKEGNQDPDQGGGGLSSYLCKTWLCGPVD